MAEKCCKCGEPDEMYYDYKLWCFPCGFAYIRRKSEWGEWMELVDLVEEAKEANDQVPSHNVVG